MHRSRIGVVLIDHPESSYAAGAAFWSAVAGRDREPEEGPYESLGLLAGALPLELQRTGDDTPARVHLDIETDDVAAEVARVLALGAAVVEQRDGYTILTDPGGLVFCVVPVQRPDTFDDHATTWT